VLLLLLVLVTVLERIYACCASSPFPSPFSFRVTTLTLTHTQVGDMAACGGHCEIVLTFDDRTYAVSFSFPGGALRARWAKLTSRRVAPYLKFRNNAQLAAQFAGSI
jgi:hypothetical protein